MPIFLGIGRCLFTAICQLHKVCQPSYRKSEAPCPRFPPNISQFKHVFAISARQYLHHGSSPLRISPKSPKSRRPKGMAVKAGSGALYLFGHPTNTRQLGERGAVVRYSPSLHRTSTQRTLKRKRPSPPASLARWLDIDSDWERELYWLSVRKYISPSSLPNILLEHLHRSKYLNVHSALPHLASKSDSHVDYSRSVRPVLPRSSRGHPTK